MNETETILMVDDSQDDLFLLRECFAQAKCKHPLQEVHNGEEAIAYLNGDGPYADRSKFPLPIAMLLDLNMPKKSGFDVLVWLRAQPGIKRLPVYILTASNRAEDVDIAFQLGATGFLVKPSTLELLTSMLRCLTEWVEINHFPTLTEVGKNQKTGPLPDKHPEPLLSTSLR